MNASSLKPNFSGNTNRNGEIIIFGTLFYWQKNIGEGPKVFLWKRSAQKFGSQNIQFKIFRPFESLLNRTLWVLFPFLHIGNIHVRSTVPIISNYVHLNPVKFIRMINLVYISDIKRFILLFKLLVEYNLKFHFKLYNFKNGFISNHIYTNLCKPFFDFFKTFIIKMGRVSSSNITWIR